MTSKATHTGNADDAKGRRCSWVKCYFGVVADNVEHGSDDDKEGVKQDPRLGEPLQTKRKHSNEKLQGVAAKKNQLKNVEDELGLAVCRVTEKGVRGVT